MEIINRLQNYDPNLRCANFIGTIFDKNKSEELAKAIRTNRILEQLIIHDKYTTEDGVEIICDALCHNTHINFLMFSCCNKYGVKLFATNRTIKHWSLQHHMNITYLVEIIHNAVALEFLDLASCQLKDDDIVQIVEALQNNKTIHKLRMNCEFNKLSPVSFAALTKLPPNIRNLYINSKLNGDPFFESLVYNSSLEYLDISCSRLSDDAKANLIKSIAVDGPLTHLIMNFCSCFFVEDFITIAEALKTNNTLEVLNLKGHDRVEENNLQIVEAFTDALQINFALKEIIGTNVYDELLSEENRQFRFNRRFKGKPANRV